MPYEIRKRGSKWCVQKEGGGKTFGCHPSKDKAEAQMRAIYASENKGKSLTVFKGADGTRYMFMVSSNTYEDREAQTMHTDALKAYVDDHWTEQGFKTDNAQLFWHDGPSIGEIVWADLQGPFLVEVAKERASGLPAIQSYVDAIWSYLEKAEEPYGASIGFAYRKTDLEPDGKAGTFRAIRKFETSVLPLKYAANPYTFSGVLSMENAREKELDKITGKPGFLSNLKKLLSGAEESLDEAGVQHKELGPVATKADLVDVIVLAVKSTMEQAVALGQKAEGEEAAAIDLHQIAGAALDELLDVPAVALDTAEAILAVEDEAAGADATEETEQESTAADVAETTQVNSDKALESLAALATQVLTDNGALATELKALTAQVKGVADLPSRMGEMEKAIKAMQAEFTDRPRASLAEETAVRPDIQATLDALVKKEEKAKNGSIWPG